MRRIISHRPTTIVSSFCAVADGGRATIAAAGDGGLLPKPIVRTFHTKPPTDSFGVFVTARKQLKNEERARKALGILFRDYGGRAAQDDGLDEEDGSDEDDESDEEKVAKRKVYEEEFDVFITNLAIECETDHEKYESVRHQFHILINQINQDDEVGDATQNDRVDKLAEIAEHVFRTNSFTIKLMTECEPKYVKHFREIIEKVRKKMIQDDGILRAFELVTNLMSRYQPDYEKLLCEVLEKEVENIRKLDITDSEHIEKLEEEGSFEEALVTENFLWSLWKIEGMKPQFMAYEVIEKVAKNVGNENVRKIAEKKLDKIVTDSFIFETMEVQRNIPHYQFSRLLHEDKDAFDGDREVGAQLEGRKSELDEEKVAKTNTCKVSEEELDVFLTNLAIECETDHDYEFVREQFHEVIEEMNQDDELGNATQNDRVDKLAEIVEAFVTNSFAANLMIECEPKYEKRFREVIEKMRKKMIQDDEILRTFELLTNLSKCEPEYEKLLCEVLEKVGEKITQDDKDEKGGNENIHKIEKLTKLDKLDILAKLDMKAGSFEKKLVEFVAERYLHILRDVEKEKPYFMAYEVIEKVAKKVGNENVRKTVEGMLDAIVTELFVFETKDVQRKIPIFMYVRLMHEDKESLYPWMFT